MMGRECGVSCAITLVLVGLYFTCFSCKLFVFVLVCRFVFCVLKKASVSDTCVNANIKANTCDSSLLLSAYQQLLFVLSQDIYFRMLFALLRTGDC